MNEIGKRAPARSVFEYINCRIFIDIAADYETIPSTCR